MTVLFVTAWIALPHYRTDKTPESRLEHFRQLASSGVDVLVFASPPYLPLLVGMPNVRCIAVSDFAKQLRTWRLVDSLFVAGQLRLPEVRNMMKDTQGFLQLILCKPDFVALAMEAAPDYDFYAWIDFNVFHVVHDKAEGQRRLRALCRSRPAEIPRDALLFPVIWDKGGNTPNGVHWRFPGGFFLGARAPMRHWVDTLYPSKVEEYLRTFQVLSWEVNVWAWMEEQGHFAPRTYRGWHDNSILPEVFALTAAATAAPQEEATPKKAGEAPQNMIVVLRGHIRDAFDTPALRDLLCAVIEEWEQQNEGKSVKLYIHTWSTVANALSWRNIAADPRAVTRASLHADLGAFLGARLCGVIIDDDADLPLHGATEGFLNEHAGGTAPLRGWKNYWYGQHRALELVHQIHSLRKEDANTVAVSMRFDVLSAGLTTNMLTPDLVHDFFRRVRAAEHPLLCPVFVYETERNGVDNLYAASVSHMHALVSHFHFCLDGVLAQHPTTINPEVLVPRVSLQLFPVDDGPCPPSA